MTAIRFVASLVGATLVTACAEPSRPSDDSARAPGPVSTAAAGAASGALVVRGESFFLFVIFDAQKGLAAVLNGRDGILGCGEPITVSRPGMFQDVISPQDELLINELFRADGAFVHLYTWNGVFPENDDEFCALVTGPRLARGRAHLVYTDNDLVAFLRDPVRTNSFGLSANGVVTYTAGGTAQFSALSRISATPPHTAGQEYRINETARIGLTLPSNLLEPGPGQRIHRSALAIRLAPDLRQPSAQLHEQETQPVYELRWLALERVAHELA